MKQEAASARCRKLATCRQERQKSCSNNLEQSQPFRKLAIDIEAQPARR
ncbi:TPA: hypothetical protein ACR8QZ_004736 [Enterobacter roggenkampii]|nr:hypothetical protein [Enterobacter asburiae]